MSDDPYRIPPPRNVTVSTDLLRRMHRALYAVGCVNPGWWKEIDALKQDVAKAIFQDEPAYTMPTHDVGEAP